ncbi:GNAT family N-acetyltransferase [Conexibacter sp. JD483]|uniref:GNAT family N-acetyltransferase n=1 Tax=unclassified Conexibacter TaxID=2627773 RepID=UPI0027253709|nr:MULTISPECIES: GNAT family N-acetyltransferase [unclassified Conexibacter]MDO8188561.1 GNAT family N-acetyltransferase [Conexibacter sp. CPCC 205706]MDO8199944.1 GNAT family N-acetyltransferase [Conexibacter sp. CPCC 205762]MDR9370696.1 GNAT family N-acetyltransferase [Conexibacter sp. JD483]
MERIGTLTTSRLLLREWQAGDEKPMATINRDPEVVRHLNRPVDPDAVNGFFATVTAHWDQHGFGFWAIEPRVGPLAGRFVGFVGVAYPTFLPELAQRPELGWRLARESWGAGYATEAAVAARDDAATRLGFDDLISIIHPDNERSQRVAAKVGMTIEGPVFNPHLNMAVDIWHRALRQQAPPEPPQRKLRRTNMAPALPENAKSPALAGLFCNRGAEI